MLANGFLALGIGRNADDFLENSFKDLEPSISQHAFKKLLREEWETSRKMAWLAQSDFLRDIAKALPPPLNDSDPLSGIRDFSKDAVFTLAEKMLSTIAESLYQQIEKIPKYKIAAEAESQANNSKFCIDPLLFTMKCVSFHTLSCFPTYRMTHTGKCGSARACYLCRYGGVDDFDKGVRELVGAPHPQVWDEIDKEHRQRGDSHKKFNPGNYDTETTSEQEFLVVIDPVIGKQKTKGPR